MVALQTLYSFKKTYYYNFFPTKIEEDFLKSRKALAGIIDCGRKLIEMRDVYPPPTVDARNPWQIKKTLNQYETRFGILIVSYNDVFDHVIRYWTLDMANYIVMGQRVGVTLWDVTQERNPKKYQSNEVFLQMITNDDCLLSCMELIKDKKLKIDDEICLHWDFREGCFKFKLVL